MNTHKHLLIVHHTQSGSTKKMTDAIINGAKQENIIIRSRSALKANSEDLLWADGLLLGTPENFGYMSGAMKHFLDEVFYDCLERVNGLPYAIYIKAGNDGTGAKNSIEKILSGLSLKKIQDPVIAIGSLTESVIKECEELGQLMAMGLTESIF
ncbi:MAG: flavodoxin family protein [Woeseiaceae bacterium]|nr:NAD(P)H-dependent oxidoreductase [Woeseiaceae bacterium]|tara:strand:+ start:10205 stop:10666 length:462 start_codon:yes stop_codon:yes gene_type:complete